MKFGHQVTFNAHPDFVGKNIDYDKLKRLIYDIERVETGEYHANDPVYMRTSMDGGRPALRASMDGGRPASLMGEEGAESPGQPLLARSVSVSLHNPLVAKAQQSFQAAFHVEVVKVSTFYRQELQRLAREIDVLSQRQEALTASLHNGPTGDSARAAAQEYSGTIQKATDLYQAVQNLLEFRRMNRDGFRKTLKKHDKVTQVPLMSTLMPEVDMSLPPDEDHRLQEQGRRVLEVHATLSGGSKEQSEAQLQTRCERTQLDFHRPTVWRDMVVLERSSHGPEVEVVDGRGPSATTKKSNERTRSAVIGIFAICVFAALLRADIFNGERSKNMCLAMLVLLAILWSTEAIPLYVTSMLVPALTVVLRIIPAEDGSPMKAPDAAHRVFEVMFSPVIMLLLGGFAIASALSKHYIAKAVATSIMARVRKPSNVVLASMFIATFFSMWISNVASPVLCFALVQPILRRELSNRRLCKCIVMGIAMASNVGGMTSPISSPQNIFAIAVMADNGAPPNWIEWFAIALPVSFACNIGIWMLLRMKYKPDQSVSEVLPLRGSKDPINMTQVMVVVVSLITVGLWCVNTALRDVVGDQGIVAIIPLAVFFGTGILTKDDFNSFLWNIVMLAQGGLVLSEAVKKSGILTVVAAFIEDATRFFSVWGVLAVFCLAVVICTTFISHTVGAMVILPVVQTVGKTMLPVAHPRMLVMANVLMCSGAMGLPVSGFPNMTASYLEDSMGQVYADISDFLTIGIASSAIAWTVIVTLGYSIMYSLGW